VVDGPGSTMRSGSGSHLPLGPQSGGRQSHGGRVALKKIPKFLPRILGALFDPPALHHPEILLPPTRWGPPPHRNAVNDVFSEARRVFR